MGFRSLSPESEYEEVALQQMERLSVAIWIFDLDHNRVIWANREARRIWCAESAEELYARDMSKNMSPGVQARLRHYKIDLAEPERVLNEQWTVYPRGVPCTLNIAIRGVRLPDGRIAGLAEGSPIEQNRVPDMLRSVDALLHAPVMITLVGSEGQALYMNPAARASRTGLGLSLRQRFVDAEVASEFIDRLEADGQAKQIGRVHTARGERWHEVDARKCSDAATGRDAFLVTELDVTEMKEAEERAEAADRTKSEFLANMSHEIRTPLNGVLGMADILAMTSLDKRQADLVRTITRSGKSLLGVLNDILDFSKLNAGRLTLEDGPVDFRELSEDVAALMSAHVEKHDLEINLRIARDLPKLLTGDFGRLRQIMLNIVGNAVKFTEEGDVFVDVGGELTPDGGRYRLNCEVTDTGPGIPEDQARRIFDQFSQIDGSSSRTHEGSGLGLSICSSLLEMMGGEIGVRSTPGEGSVFWFRVELPVREAAERPAALAGFDRAPRVLMADDNAHGRESLAELLASFGCDVTPCSDGAAAITALCSAGAPEYDCVILDQDMPGLRGTDVARAIRANAALAGLRTLLLTSAASFEPEEGGEFFDAQLTKPVRADALRAAITARPAAITSAKDSASEPAPKTREPEPVAKTEGLDVLICEDHAINQKFVREIMGLMDFSFEIVSNGREALEMFETRKPRLILMDISMPGMSGDEVAQEIRRRETGGEHTPIIAFTAHVMREDIERFKKAGADDFLAKPVSPKDLIGKVQGWMQSLDAPTPRQMRA